MPKQIEINPGDRVNVAARSNRIGLRGLLAALVGGAVLAFMLDPDRGRSRRAVTADRVAGTARRTRRHVGRIGRRVGSTVAGWRERAAHAGETGADQLDDIALAHRVESELFRDQSVPKGRLNINVENGVAVLRGTVDDEGMIASLERKVLRIPGVVGVRNLLHRTGTPAPNWPETAGAR
ncbi:MAG TPA: BON domain-containing protein [Candidatus Limnocylindrales bacterium]|jgi:hypothetical protein